MSGRNRGASYAENELLGSALESFTRVNRLLTTRTAGRLLDSMSVDPPPTGWRARLPHKHEGAYQVRMDDGSIRWMDPHYAVYALEDPYYGCEVLGQNCRHCGTEMKERG